MGVGLRLKELLRERNITIKEFAKLSGISVNTLYSITKRDSNRVDIVLLEKIAKELHVTVDYLTGHSNDPKLSEMDIFLVEELKKIGIIADPHKKQSNDGTGVVDGDGFVIDGLSAEGAKFIAQYIEKALIEKFGISQQQEQTETPPEE